MNVEKFTENIIEQIKEVQLKLGFVQEVIRLYFPAESLSRLLQVQCRSAKELLDALEREQRFHNTVLGKIHFSLCRDERIEVAIPPAGAAYVHEFVPDPPFLLCMIQLFQENHSLTIEEICSCFAQFSSQYVCEKMEPGTDFDYVLYFPDQKPDPWYYCIKIEMGHTIYHRFSKEDYKLLLQ